VLAVDVTHNGPLAIDRHAADRIRSRALKTPSMISAATTIVQKFQDLGWLPRHETPFTLPTWLGSWFRDVLDLGDARRTAVSPRCSWSAPTTWLST
jgi:hypothetical protein